MDNTPNLQLPYLIAAQAQKHVTHNEALRSLDAIVQLLVLDKDLASPPGSPTDGSRYIVAASPSGAWAGQAGKVAAWQDAAWVFYTPREGWLTWVADEDKIYAYTGSAWAEFVSGAGSLHHVVEDTAPQLGGNLDANGHNVDFGNGKGITDDAGNEQLLFRKTASAVNQVGITNAATGNAPQVAAEGDDANINLKLRGKGTGFVDLDKLGFADGKGVTDDAGNEQLLFRKTASAVNQVAVTNAATGNAPQLAAEGDDTNISLKLRGKGTGFVDADKLGVNATADTTNRLAVKSAASLLDNVGNGHQQKINKAAAGDTASTLYQTNYSGRAEFGLTGDDNFHVKVSPDGSAWKEAIVVDRTDGRVAMGAPDASLTTDGLQVHAPNTAGSVTAARWSADSGGPGVNLYKSRGAAVGTHGIVSSGDSGGGNTWRFSDGVGFIPAAAIRAAVDGTPGVNDMPGRLVFLTTLDGAAALSERMRITNDGKFGFGTTGPSNFASFEGIAAPQTDNAYTCGTAAKRWSDVYAVSGTVNTSDARLKTDIEDSRLGLAFILNCRPRSYRWLEGGVTVEWDEEAVEVQEPLTEAQTVTVPVIEMRDGVAIERQIERVVSVPVVDQVPVVDEAGQPVLVDGAPKMHAVQRMHTVTETSRVKREVKRAGGRTHYGLVAQEVQAAAAMAGVTDFAGWVLADKGDPNSTQGLRYDQFIAPLIKAVQELAARVVALEARRTAS
jgi:hypothetical protein